MGPELKRDFSPARPARDGPTRHRIRSPISKIRRCHPSRRRYRPAAHLPSPASGHDGPVGPVGTAPAAADAKGPPAEKARARAKTPLGTPPQQTPAPSQARRAQLHARPQDRGHLVPHRPQNPRDAREQEQGEALPRRPAAPGRPDAPPERRQLCVVPRPDLRRGLGLLENTEPDNQGLVGQPREAARRNRHCGAAHHLRRSAAHPAREPLPDTQHAAAAKQGPGPARRRDSSRGRGKRSLAGNKPNSRHTGTGPNTLRPHKPNHASTGRDTLGRCGRNTAAQCERDTNSLCCPTVPDLNRDWDPTDAGSCGRRPAWNYSSTSPTGPRQRGTTRSTPGADTSSAGSATCSSQARPGPSHADDSSCSWHSSSASRATPCL